MKISVCVGSVRPDTLACTVSSLVDQSHQDFELIIVGQGQDGNLHQLGESLAGQDGRIQYVPDARFGLSRARNRGIGLSTGDVIAFTDDDCEPDEDWLEVINETFNEDPDLGLVGGAVVAPAAPSGRLCTCPALIPQEAIYDPRNTPGRPPDGWGWIGANFAIQRRAVDVVGTFDEELGAGTSYPAGEDTDYGLRLERANFRMLSTPRSSVNHTYGSRCGLRNRIQHTKNYARGNGALAAKLTLSNDDRGPQWLKNTHDQPASSLRSGALFDAVVSTYRYRLYLDAYESCLRRYRLDPSTGCLARLNT